MTLTQRPSDVSGLIGSMERDGYEEAILKCTHDMSRTLTNSRVLRRLDASADMYIYEQVLKTQDNCCCYSNGEVVPGQETSSMYWQVVKDLQDTVY